MNETFGRREKYERDGLLCGAFNYGWFLVYFSVYGHLIGPFTLTYIFLIKFECT